MFQDHVKPYEFQTTQMPGDLVTKVAIGKKNIFNKRSHICHWGFCELRLQKNQSNGEELSDLIFTPNFRQKISYTYDLQGGDDPILAPQPSLYMHAYISKLGKGTQTVFPS